MSYLDTTYIFSIIEMIIGVLLVIYGFIVAGFSFSSYVIVGVVLALVGLISIIYTMFSTLNKIY